MSRDLSRLMHDATDRPQRELDLDELWRRGRRRRWGKRLGAAAVGLVLIAGLAVLVQPSLRPDPPVVGNQEAGPLGVLQSVTVPAPGPAVAAADRIWVTSYRGPLRWVEPSTGRTGPGPVTSGACGSGGGVELIVVVRCEGSGQRNDELVAVAPEDRTVRWTTPVDGRVTAVADAAGRVLALAQSGSDGRLTIHDATTGEEIGRIAVERASVWNLVAAADHAWMTATTQPDPSNPTRQIEIIAVDLDDVAVTGRRTLGEEHGSPQHLDLRDNELWLPVRDEMLVLTAGTLDHVASVALPVATSPPTAGPTVTATQDLVWVVHANGVFAIDPISRTLEAATKIGPLRITQPSASLDGQLWIPDRTGDRLMAVGW